jgi:hypothetical protein
MAKNELYWEGITKGRSYNERYRVKAEDVRNNCLDRKWQVALHYIAQDEFGALNAVCVDDPYWRTPLHVFAELGAPVERVEALIGMGALCSVRDKRALRPVDLVPGSASPELIAMLEPAPRRWVSAEVLDGIQTRLRRLIRGRADHFVDEHELRFPQVAVLLEMQQPRMWCPIPGMYGGFLLELEQRGDEAVLLSSSGSRVFGGSGQRHEITAGGIELVEQGHM